MHSLSQPTHVAETARMLDSVNTRWHRLFGDIDLIGNISSANKSDREWLLDCMHALKTLDDVIALATEQRRAVLESIRYEYPIADKFISESELSMLSDADLMSDSAAILQEYGIPQDEYFTGDFI